MPKIGAAFVVAEVSSASWHGHLHTSSRHGEEVVEREGLFIHNAEQGRFSHEGMNLHRDPWAELDLARPSTVSTDCHLWTYTSENFDVNYCIGADSIPTSWNMTNRVPRSDGGFDIVEVHNVVSEMKFVQPVDLVSLPVEKVANTTDVPWMCDCEGNSEFCNMGVVEGRAERCTAFIALAAEIGFNINGPIGEPGSLLQVDPISSHLVGSYCNFAKGLGCNYATTTKIEEIQRIYWRGETLAGKFSSRINDLQALTSLSITGHPLLTGQIPDLDLPKVLQVTLRDNGFSGQFPTLNLPNVWMLSLANNVLVGSLPDGLGVLMPRLRRLYLGNNALTGTIPNDLPFFNNTNKINSDGSYAASILCGLSGISWDCPIPSFAMQGPSYSCNDGSDGEFPTCVDLALV